MFNAIFGNFLFSRAAAPAPVNEAATQTAATATISTQTCNEQLAVGCSNGSKQQQLGKAPEDWVIVDPSLEQSATCKAAQTDDDNEQQTEGGVENLVDMQEIGPQPMPADWLSRQQSSSDAAVLVAAPETEQDDDVMLGSFFDRHEAAEEEVKQARVEEAEHEQEDMAEELEHKSPVKEHEPTITKEEETWLITPLPCLTSITSSQRSIVENGTLENLLIEHPSMSIFMSATASQSVTSSMRADDEEDEAIYEADYQAHRKLEQKQKQKQAGKKDELRQQIQAKKAAVASTQAKPAVTQPESTKFGTRTFASVLKEKQQQQPQEPAKAAKPVEVQVVLVKPAPAKPVETAKAAAVVIVKSVAEKRKESDKSERATLSSGSSSESLSGVVSPSATVCKAGKKESKKSKKAAAAAAASGSSPANKENMQVRTLLFCDLKKAAGRGGLESALTTANQMKRHNKNALFSKSNVSSKRQRKYHNLQQPSFASYSSNQQF